MKTRIVSFLLIVIMMVSLLCGTAFATESTEATETLQIIVTKIIDDGNSKTVYIDFDNQTDNEIIYGWAGRKSIISITTDEGTHEKDITQISTKIAKGITSWSFSVSGAVGTVETICLTNLIYGGNPTTGRTLEYVEIYSAETGSDWVSVDFSKIPTRHELSNQSNVWGTSTTNMLQEAVNAMPPDSQTILEDYISQIGGQLEDSSIQSERSDDSETADAETLIMPKADEGTLLILVTDIFENGNNKTIQMYFDNRLDVKVGFGFMGDETSYVVLETSEGTFFHELSQFNYIVRGTSSQSFMLEDVPGVVKSIKLTNLISGNLPSDGVAKSVEVYSSNSDTNDSIEFEAVVLRDRNFFSWQKILTPVMGIAFPLMFIFTALHNWKAYKYRKKAYRAIINKATQETGACSGKYQTYQNNGNRLHKGTSSYRDEIFECVRIFKTRVEENRPNEAAVQLRYVLEYMLYGIWESTSQRASSNSIDSFEEMKDYEKIDLLFSQGVITSQTQSHYHKIRQITNRGAHINSERPISVHELNYVQKILIQELDIYFDGYCDGRGASTSSGSSFDMPHQSDVPHQHFVQQEQQRIFQQQHQEAVRMHEDASRQFTQQVQQQQFDHFSHQNVTPTDQGGFVPPPPPPPPPPGV